MHALSLVAALASASSWLTAAALPITSSPPASSKSTLITKREAGPAIGGANFPDPCILKVGSTWYSFATRTIGSNVHIPVASSTDFTNWQTVSDGNGQHDALPNLPSWVDADSPNTWAPDVNHLDDGTFVMYYAATSKSNTAQHCIGAAKSDSILGPYTPVGDGPFVCPSSQGGAIDASGYNDNGKRYVAYKVDGNSQGHGGACGNDGWWHPPLYMKEDHGSTKLTRVGNQTVAPYVPTPIILQPVASDGVTFDGGATQLLDNNGASDTGIVEAPSLGHSGNTYVLFFSSGCFVDGSYTVNYATSSSITGPYTRASRPLYKTGDRGLTAPGGADLDHDGQHLVFHANSGNGRALYTTTVDVSGGNVKEA
ncbi:glycoside hydrolase family 43 protein [Polychaeton citri CBS 116435]|uniref:Glycoside hydrolase family 43 protein n=1 Tax=Polychaeton citri CBS 116435 TaxID=1314669 RepID=A0A9P4UK61_9PEZI|nr:glycoside hydrolase family 43 protein [Polychaeton citri CBS 116435]